MAKQKSTFQFSGKIGTIVGMKGANGESYIREYVKPANPKSTQQTERRVRMALAGLMSKLTAPTVLYGMGKAPRARRSAYTSNIIRRAVTTTSGGQAIAKINPADVLFSDGINQPIAFETQPTLANHVVSFPYAATTFGGEPDLAAVVVVGIARNAGDIFNAVVSGTMVRDSETAVNLRVPEDAIEVYWYYIPVFRAEGVDSTSYERDLTFIKTDTTISAVVTISERGSVAWRRSVYVGSVGA